MDRKRPRRATGGMRIASSSSPFLCLAATALFVCCSAPGSEGFVLPPSPRTTSPARLETSAARPAPAAIKHTNTALHVWWFGGTDETTESGLMDGSPDSCELVAVRIDRTSPNSRLISGDITVDAPLEDVWAILCDYDHLATHVPNLVESRRVSTATARPSLGTPGDGQYRCRLYQKGAQKIVGFEFGASVTMDMTEQIVVPPNAHNFPDSQEHAFYPQERKILFKCVESPFFSEFDGEWKAVEHRNASGDVETVLSYQVEVRPRGPVPVLALEWRIREDVPTNLRAVKYAALTVGAAGVQARKMRQETPRRAMATNGSSEPSIAKPKPTKQMQRVSSAKTVSSRRQEAPRELRKATARSQLTPLGQSKLSDARPTVARVRKAGGDWFDDETMAAYLTKNE